MTDSSFGPLIDTTARIVTWNLWWRFGPWEARLPAIVETLRRLDADIICLQEVWLERDTGATSAALVAEALGWNPANIAVGNRADLDGVGFANAVISRWPIVSSEWRPLFSPPEYEEYRTVVRADVDGPRGPLQVFTTHLHWRLDHSHIRQEQVREIARFVKESPHRSYPAVLTGDFNADPASDEVRMITGRAAVPEPPIVFFDAWEVAGATATAPIADTWSNTNPYAVRDLEFSRRIDYVFAGFPKQGGAGHAVRADLVGLDAIEVDRPVGGFGGRDGSGAVAGPVMPSDHFGVVADLRY